MEDAQENLVISPWNVSSHHLRYPLHQKIKNRGCGGSHLWGWGRHYQEKRSQQGRCCQVDLNLAFSMGETGGRHPYTWRFLLLMWIAFTKGQFLLCFQALFVSAASQNSPKLSLCQRGISWGGTFCPPWLSSIFLLPEFYHILCARWETIHWLYMRFIKFYD